MILNRLVWQDVDDVPDLDELHRYLTVYPEVYVGASVPQMLYEMDGNKIGVPRVLGLQIFSGIYEDRTSFPELQWPKFNGKYWKGQEDAVNAIVDRFTSDTKFKYGARLESPCGTGKCLMSLAIASKLHTKALVVVHKEDLEDQWKNTAEEFFGVKSGTIRQGNWDFKDKHLVTASAQTLYSRMVKIKTIANEFGLVIYDEGHRYSARTFEMVQRQFNCRHRLAVSATWRRTDGLENIWNWHIGDLAWEAHIEQLTGRYAQVKLNIGLKDKNFRIGPDRINNGKYITAISKHAGYNKWIVKQIVRANIVGRKVLILSHRVKQLEDIHKYLGEEDIKSGLYLGKINGKKAKKKQLQDAADCDIILATYQMMREGTDIPKLDTLIFATPAADIEQPVGRIRRPYVGKKDLLVVDPVLDTHYNKALGAKRRRMYVNLNFTSATLEKA